MKDVFQLKRDLDDDVIDEILHSSKSKHDASENFCEYAPYQRTVKEIGDIKWEQSPIAKVETVYQALKFTLAEEVDEFWRDSDRFLSSNERDVDIDNL